MSLDGGAFKRNLQSILVPNSIISPLEKSLLTGLSDSVLVNFSPRSAQQPICIKHELGRVMTALTAATDPISLGVTNHYSSHRTPLVSGLPSSASPSSPLRVLEAVPPALRRASCSGPPYLCSNVASSAILSKLHSFTSLPSSASFFSILSITI